MNLTSTESHSPKSNEEQKDEDKQMEKVNISDFDIEGVLGEGSFGKVYCARQKKDNK